MATIGEWLADLDRAGAGILKLLRSYSPEPAYEALPRSPPSTPG